MSFLTIASSSVEGTTATGAAGTGTPTGKVIPLPITIGFPPGPGMIVCPAPSGVRGSYRVYPDKSAGLVESFVSAAVGSVVATRLTVDDGMDGAVDGGGEYFLLPVPPGCTGGLVKSTPYRFAAACAGVCAGAGVGAGVGADGAPPPTCAGWTVVTGCTGPGMTITSCPPGPGITPAPGGTTCPGMYGLITMINSPLSILYYS